MKLIWGTFAMTMIICQNRSFNSQGAILNAGCPTDSAEASSMVLNLLEQDPFCKLVGRERPEIKAFAPQSAGFSSMEITLALGDDAHRRLGRFTVNCHRSKTHRIDTIELSPIGSSTIPPSPVLQNGLLGGFQSQDPRSKLIAETTSVAMRLLSGEEWLKQAFETETILQAGTQVVAGLNSYVATYVTTGPEKRKISFVLYEPIAGPPRITWLRIDAY